MGKSGVFVFCNPMIEDIWEVDDSFLEILVEKGIKLGKAGSNLLNFEEYQTVGLSLEKQGAKAKYIGRCAGGSGSNIAAGMAKGLAKSGKPSYFLGGIGYDEQGSFLEKEMQEDYGVHPFLVRKKGFPTSTIYTLVTPDTERTFAVHLGAAEKVGPDDIPRDALDALVNSEYFVVTGYKVHDSPDTTQKLIETARKKGVKIVFDLSCPLHMSKAKEGVLLQKILEGGVHVLLANEEETEVLYGVEVGSGAQPYLNVLCNEYLGFPIDIVAQKRQDKGAIIANRHVVIISPAYKVNVVNRDGAGDGFATGFTLALINKKGIETAGTWGNYCASRVIMQDSPRMGFTMEEIRKGVLEERYKVGLSL